MFTFAIPGISIGGHLGGLVGGVVCGTAYELIARRTPRHARRRCSALLVALGAGRGRGLVVGVAVVS